MAWRNQAGIRIPLKSLLSEGLCDTKFAKCVGRRWYRDMTPHNSELNMGDVAPSRAFEPNVEP